MKRHSALAPLSEDHHHELVQARRLLRAADGTPEERLGVAREYVAAFFTATVDHFRREEEGVFPLFAAHAPADPLLARILREHMELHGLARALRAEVAADEVSPDLVREVGTLLRDHVRLEEQELFEAVQRTVPAIELERLHAR